MGRSQLVLFDKDVLLTSGLPLTDKHINFVHMLFKKQYQGTSGFVSTVLQLKYILYECMQNVWICISIISLCQAVVQFMINKFFIHALITIDREIQYSRPLVIWTSSIRNLRIKNDCSIRVFQVEVCVLLEYFN